MGLLLLVLLVILLLGVQPRWGYARDWGYGPTGGVSVLLIVVLVLVLFSVVPWV